ncbi:MAG: hypothetical protein RL037_541 [Bacteroidota bacterium]
MRYYLIIGFVSILILGQSVVFAQAKYENIQIPLGKFEYEYSGCEPSIAIDASNPNKIVAGSILNGYHYSIDAGKTWKSKALVSPFGVYGDPVLKVDGRGRIYYFHLASYAKTTHLDRIVCQFSDKISGPFSKGSSPKPNGTKVQDKQWVTIHPETNHLYMTWTQFDAYDSSNPEDSSFIMFSKSIDGGISWSIPLRISKYGGDCLDGDNTVEGAVPAIGLDNALIVTWTGPNGLMMQRSMDDGKTWLPQEKKIIDHPGGWDIDIPGFYRANGLPFLVSDMSRGERNGTLYLNWCDQGNGPDDTDVFLMFSNDNGENWQGPIQVNKETRATHQFLTCLTVDQVNGDLHFVYYDRSSYPEGSLKTDVAWTVSNDGGQSFKETIISEKPFQPNEYNFFGDYLGIAAHDGKVRPIWPRMDQGRISLWTALIDLTE